MPMKFPETPPGPMLAAEDTGIAWGMGAFGGGVYAAVKGFRNAPRGEKLSGAWMSAKIRGPVYGGNFAVWGGLFTASDQLMANIRGVHDGYNSVIGGAITGGALAARAGFKQFYRNAMIGGVLLGLIEGGTVLFGLWLPETPGGDKADKLHGETPFGPMTGGKSLFRGSLDIQRMAVPREGPTIYRKMRHAWDIFFGPWTTEYLPDPMGISFQGWLDKRLIKCDAALGNKYIRLPVRSYAEREDTRVAKFREDQWAKQQEPARTRQRFAPQEDYKVTPPVFDNAKL